MSQILKVLDETRDAFFKKFQIVNFRESQNVFEIKLVRIWPEYLKGRNLLTIDLLF